MAGNGLQSLGRVKLTDLAPAEGLPSDSYKLSVLTLSQSLALYSAAIIQFPVSDGALLRSGLDSARLYFHQKASYPAADMVNNNDPRDWCKTSGYNADPQLWLETYDYRPGLPPLEPNNTMEFPPAALPDIFSLLAKEARHKLDAISFYLNLRSSPFTDVLIMFPYETGKYLLQYYLSVVMQGHHFRGHDSIVLRPKRMAGWLCFLTMSIKLTKA